ncbi:hypothetical protein EZV62_024702 [Acer yangbiense]|uniref:Cytochrome P450 n=1 Tax=Acer yangbiense TaxID=1000413 RepID=A0A5C7GWF2_9ROSI|nr:hypothetical protein EZV62_024702 [Acer yangbiense]
MSANFSNYVKGPEWRKRFDIFGDHSLFNSDLDEWKHQRKVVRAFFSHQELNQHVAKIIPDIIEKGLIPVLDDISEQGTVVDLQDLFTRYTFEFASLIATGSNTNSLMCTRLAENQFPKAIDDACEAIFARIVIPEAFWKLQRWLSIGKERKYKESWKIIDKFWAKHMSIKQEKLSNAMTISEDEEELNALTGYLTRHDIVGQTPSSNVMRDNITGLLFATEDTTSSALSWFFWLLSKNPFSEIKIREEVRKHIFPQDQVKKWRGNLEQLNKLVYLHAAICEALRLFPPVPYQLRTPLRPDTLPSGHQVDQKTAIAISGYAMGRMASIWGEDCHEFKPERWITKEGGIKHEASHKFFAFNAGPRICPGKEIGFTLMKAIITTIIHNYHVQLVETHPVTPNLSIELRMKHGLMAKTNSRWA